MEVSKLQPNGIYLLKVATNVVLSDNRRPDLPEGTILKYSKHQSDSRNSYHFIVASGEHEGEEIGLTSYWVEHYVVLQEGGQE